MTEEQALFQAVLNDPKDDTVRLVMADWYEENGDAARGEFIRLQIARQSRGRKPLSRCTAPTHRCVKCEALWVEWSDSWSCLSPCEKCCDNVAMGEQIVRLSEEDQESLLREYELLSQYGHRWVPEGPFVAGGHIDWVAWGLAEFRRGFVERLTCSPQVWFANYRKIVGTTLLGHVTLTRVPELSPEFHWANEHEVCFALDPHEIKFKGRQIKKQYRKLVSGEQEYSFASRPDDRAYTKQVAKALLRLRFPGIEFEITP